MKKIITIVILILVSTIVQMIILLPWWSFLIPIFLLGILLPLEKWNISSFWLGFISGFLVWCVSTFYFEIIYQGEIIEKVAKLMGVWNYMIYIIAGLIGGILTGLAFYSGFLLRRGREILHLELQ